MTVPLYNLTDTWNNAGTAFTAIQMNVTNTASAAGSLLLDLQIGGTSLFNVDKTGQINFSTGTNYITPGAFALTLGNGGTNVLTVFNNQVALVGSTFSYAFNNGNDTFLFRDAADIFAMRRTTNANSLRVYNTFTDSSNYERGVFDWTTTANLLTIGTQKAGTGATREVSLQNPDSVQVRLRGQGNPILYDSGAGIHTIRDNAGQGGTFQFPATTPAALASGTTNNYNPGTVSYFQRWTANAANSVVTGALIELYGNVQFDGQIHCVINLGSGTLTLNHQDAGSTAANRFLCSTGANIVLSQNQSADLLYDNTQARWLVFKRN